MTNPNGQPQNTFVVRFWREWQDDEVDRIARWRGRIEHIQSGEGMTFYEKQQMLTFIERFIYRLPPLTNRECEG